MKAKNSIDKHREIISLKTLKMNPAMRGVMGGPTKDEAIKFLKSIGYTDKELSKLSEAIKIRQIIREVITELEKKSDLTNQIDNYYELINSIEAKRNSIQEVLNDINMAEKEAKRLNEVILTNMKKFDLNLIKSKKWVAKVETELKYNRVMPEYKTLYTNLLGQVNKKLREASEAEKAALIEAKKLEKHDVLKIEGWLMDKLKHLLGIFKNVVNSWKGFDQAVDKLPHIG